MSNSRRAQLRAQELGFCNLNVNLQITWGGRRGDVYIILQHCASAEMNK